MLERILVPLDGSKAAECVLSYVMEVGHRAKSEVVLLHVIDPQMPLNSALYSAYVRQQTQEAKKKAQDYLRGVAEGLRGARLQVNVHTMVGPTAHRILSTAESQGSGLVVISSRGRGEGETWAYGSIADRILHYSRVPVLMVRPTSSRNQPMPLFQSVVVPLDGSRLAETALPIARELAIKLTLGLQLIQVFPTVLQARSILGWDVTETEETLDGDPVKEGQLYLDNILRDLASDGVWAQGRVLLGVAASSIVEFAEGIDGAIILMCAAGSRGIGARWRVGNVAERIIHHSKTPVLLVPPRLAPHLRNQYALAAATFEKMMAPAV